jgi:hypothetical protein
MPSVTRIKATEVAMAAVAEKRTSVPAGPAVPAPAGSKTAFGVAEVPRSFVELAICYGLSAKAADASKQRSGDEPGYDDGNLRHGISHCVLRKESLPPRKHKPLKGHTQPADLDSPDPSIVRKDTFAAARPPL